MLSSMCVLAPLSIFRGLPGVSQEGLDSVHRLLLVPQPLPGSVHLLSNTQVGQTPPHPLAYDAGSHSSYRATFLHGKMPNFGG